MSPPQSSPPPWPRTQPSPLAPVFVPASQLTTHEQLQQRIRTSPVSRKPAETTPTPPVTGAPKPPPRKHTPCRYFIQGYCARGKTCWYSHENPTVGKSGKGEDAEATTPSDSTKSDEKETCSICFEVPEKFGLMAGCDHVFCLGCIREWRSARPENADSAEDAPTNTKTCPLCRLRTRYVIPSLIFPKPPSDGSENTQKAKIEAVYRRRLSSISCCYFEASLEPQIPPRSGPHARRRGPWCPFGNDCHYKHQVGEGKDARHYTFTSAELSRHRWEQQSNRRQRRAAMEFRSGGRFGMFGALPNGTIGHTGSAEGPGFPWPSWVIDFMAMENHWDEEEEISAYDELDEDGFDEDELDEDDDDDEVDEHDEHDDEDDDDVPDFLYYDILVDRVEDDPDHFFF